MRDTLERGLRLSLALLLHWRYTHTRDRHSLTFRDNEGSQTHALTEPSQGFRLCIRHPAARGMVEGLIDHEGKVTAAFIASAET